jgi:hypothetical protein
MLFDFEVGFVFVEVFGMKEVLVDRGQIVVGPVVGKFCRRRSLVIVVLVPNFSIFILCPLKITLD